MSEQNVLSARGWSSASAAFAPSTACRWPCGGSIHALIGPNGAGKTTCFNLLTKFLSPDEGEIRYRGRDITSLAPEQIARLGIVRSFQISAVFLGLTVLQNMRVALMRQHGDGMRFWRSRRSVDRFNARALELLAAVGLDDADTIAALLPYGRKRALEIAMTLALDPEIMLLDEPMAGLGQEDVARIAALIRRVSAKRSILMVEHNLSVVADLSDTITVLARGAVLAQGDYAAVSRDERVITATWARKRRRTDAVHQQAQRRYGESHVLHGVDIEVRRGELVTILGRNGAGKTTTLRAIMGILDKRSGSIRLNDQETIAMAPHRIPRLGVVCPEERAVFRSLNVTENLMLPPRLADGGMTLDEIYALFPNLRERSASSGGNLSGGEQQMLAIARILRTGAQLILLDEPTEGLAPVIVQQIGQAIRTLKQRGFTIVLVEQNFRFATKVADRHYVMEHGRVVDQMSADEARNDPERITRRLGV